MISLSWIRPGDGLYAGERALRWEVLRRPLGMPPGSEENAAEAHALHLVGHDGDEVVGCVIFRVDAGATGQLMQMAVAEKVRGQGLGRRLVCELERRLVSEGVLEVTMHAREVALGFYEKLGYEVGGEQFEEVGIPHRHMRRRLTRSV